MEVYIKEGSEGNGRFYLSATPESTGITSVIYDLSHTTQHPDETCPDGFSHFHPLKLYAGGDLVQFMKDSGKKMQIYWDDWRMEKDTAPE